MPTGSTGSAETCTAGTEAPESLAATLHAVNTMRSLAGLAPVTFSAEKNARALAAALMMKAAGRLSHSPNPAWPCYSVAGNQGAGTSNLAIGSSGAEAIRLYMDDAETPSLGHRRWILDPGATEFGSGSTDTTNALTVVGSNPETSPNTVVSWPPPGSVPWPWIFDDWSLALGNGSSRVSFEGATVAITLDGTPVSVSNVSTLPAGSGTGATLRWEVALPRMQLRAITRFPSSWSELSETENRFRSRTRSMPSILPIQYQHPLCRTPRPLQVTTRNARKRRRSLRRQMSAWWTRRVCCAGPKRAVVATGCPRQSKVSKLLVRGSSCGRSSSHLHAERGRPTPEGHTRINRSTHVGLRIAFRWQYQ